VLFRDDYKQIDEYIVKNGIDKKIEAIEDSVVNAQSAYDIFDFAYFVPHSNTQKFESAIISTKSSLFIMEFMRNIPRADKTKLQKAIIELGDPEYIYECAKFLRDINKLDAAAVSRLQKAMLETNNKKYIKKFDKKILKGIEKEEYNELQ
jgi:hypothetical protein